MKDKIENDIQRVDPRLIKELKEIQKDRQKSGIDKGKKSIRALSSLIPKSDDWPDLKQAIIEYDFNE